MHLPPNPQIKNILDTGNFNRARGMNIGQIIQTLQQSGMQNVSEGAIRSVCSEMTDDGVIYSTIDEDHFMSTWSDEMRWDGIRCDEMRCDVVWCMESTGLGSDVSNQQV